MHKILEKLDKELKKYGEKEELTPSEWKCVYEALEARYYLLTGMAMTGEDANGQYSQRYSSAPYNYHMYPEYDDYSFARGRQGGYSGNRQGNYSSNYPNSYSGNKDAMRQKLSQMMTELDSM